MTMTMTMTGKIRYKVGPLNFMPLNLQLTQRKQKSNPLLTFSLDRNEKTDCFKTPIRHVIQLLIH